MNTEKLAALFTTLSELSIAIRDELASSVPSVPETPKLTTVDTAPTTPIVTNDVSSAVELDDEGYPHDERIHAKTKTKCKSKIVKGGEAWKLVRNCDPELAKQVRTEWDAQQSSVPPATPQAPTAPDGAAIKQEGINLINKLVNDFSVVYDDVLNQLRAQFNINDYDDLIVDQYQAVADFLQGIHDDYSDIHNMILEIRGWAGDVHAASVDAALATMFTGEIGSVAYADLPALNTTMTEYRQSWVNAGFGQ